MAEDEGFVTYALWGTGELAPENATALLEEYIPDNVGTVYRPERVLREHKGLRTALDWFESPDFLGVGGAVASTDLVQSLVDDRDKNGDEVFLLALWPEKPGHEDFDFIELVQQSGVTVFDLSRALDELDLSLYSRPEPTKEEKAEAKAEAAAEKRGRGRPRKKLSDTPEEGDVDIVTEVVDGMVVATVIPAVEDAKPETPGRVHVSELRTAEEVHEKDMNDPEYAAEFAALEASMSLLQELEKFVEAKVNAYLAKRGITINIDATSAAEQDMTDGKEDDRPPFDGPYVGVDTSPYYVSKAGAYRPAPAGTKPRRGESLVNLTAEEVSAL